MTPPPASPDSSEGGAALPGEVRGVGGQDVGAGGAPGHIEIFVRTSAANRLIGEVVQSRRRPLLGPSPG